MLIHALLVVASASDRRRLRGLLQHESVLVAEVAEGSEMWKSLASDNYDLLLIDSEVLPQPAEHVLSTLRKLPDRPDVIVLQREEEAARRAALLRVGCLAVLNLNLLDDLLRGTLATLVARRREAALTRLSSEEQRELYRLSDFSSASQAMTELLALAEKVVNADSSLLIVGETGVGKEWLARAIHSEGPRAPSPFIAVNCAAVPDTLLESELFGHEKGAFTGSIRSRRGYFELAHRGTLFLDEIAEMAPPLQAKLLRVLQEKSIQRLGAERPVEVDVRIMASTNRNLEEEMAARRFRPDLYYRLGVITLHVPALRERREDIAPLVLGYLETFARQLGRSVTSMHEDALDALIAYAWPGNVRELINVVERAVLLCSGSEITLNELPEPIIACVSTRVERFGPAPGGLSEVLREGWLEQSLPELREHVLSSVESAYLTAVLRETHGGVGQAARRAGIDPRSLYNKLKHYGLRKEDFKGG